MIKKQVKYTLEIDDKQAAFIKFLISKFNLNGRIGRSINSLFQDVESYLQLDDKELNDETETIDYED